MARNVEIKARAREPQSQRRLAERLADGPAQELVQTDTFFEVPTGRLKLREFADGTAELIQYHRADDDAPTESRYLRSPVPEPGVFKDSLANALGIRAVVRKRRQLYLIGRTRLHLDEVEGLGSYLELEVVLDAEESGEDGVRIARELMRELGIEEEDLVAPAYVDLLEARRSAIR